MADEGGGKKKEDGRTWQDVTWRAGRQVDGFVDRAIESGDYSDLSSQINSALNRAVDEMHDALFGQTYRTGSSQGKSGAGSFRTTYRRSGQNAWESAQGKTAGNASFGRGSARVKASGSARLKKWIGLPFAAFNLLGAIALLASAEMGGFIFFGVLAAIFFTLGWSGKQDEESIRKAHKVMQMAGGRDVISVEEVASALGESKEQTAKDLKEMIRRQNLSGTVYLDKDNTTLMLSPEAYRQYQEVMKQYEERKREENSRRKPPGRGRAEERGDAAPSGEGSKAGTGTENLDPETRKVLQEGRAFIVHIHQKNDEIPGEEMSAKLDRLERIMTRIFDQVEKDPKSAPDMRKLMSYYIPTTQKLIDTYASLDEQHIQGSNIDEAKKQIEDSVDAINDAFEKFLDSFFEATAWDVSTETAVLKSMMQQDGLAEDEFQKMRRQSASGPASVGQASAGQSASGQAFAGQAAAVQEADAQSAERKQAR